MPHKAGITTAAPNQPSFSMSPLPVSVRMPVTMVQKSNWMTSMRGETSLLVVIEYNPAVAE